MADRRIILFPCDHKSWQKVKAILTSAKASCGVEPWIMAFQRAHDVIHNDDLGLASGEAGGAKSKTRNVFSGLRVFLDSKTTLEESYDYTDHVFPLIVDLALEIENLKPSDGLEILRQRRDGSRVISRRLAASIVSCAFLCLFPGRCPSLGQQSRLETFSFDDFFLHLDSDFQCEKLRCILRYFSTASELHSKPLENVIFSRKVLRLNDVPKFEDWVCSKQPLCPVFVHTSDCVQSSASANTVQFTLGRRQFGGMVLGKGHSQEDLWFCKQTELLSGILFIECLAENEAIFISGSDITSFSDSALSSASSSDIQQGGIRLGTSIYLVNSPRSGGSGDMKQQAFRHHIILGLLSKVSASLLREEKDLPLLPVENLALASGSSDEIPGGTGSSSAVEDDVSEETNETDLPTSLESLCSSSSSSYHQLPYPNPSSSAEHETASRSTVRHSRPNKNLSWRSNSSSDSSNSFPGPLSRTMSFEVESSACPTPDDAPAAIYPNRHIGILHSNPSSRRGSMLQGQSSFSSEFAADAPGFSGYGRRRSSGMSDTSRRSSSSSGSSTGKRSSTDYSSEMEEYCENFQRSIISTAVIEEEATNTNLVDEDVVGAAAGAVGSFVSEPADSQNVNTVSRSTGTRKPQKFSIDHPQDVPKPKPIRIAAAAAAAAGYSASTVMMPCHPTALDHFVDNLINEVAQDSKLEIEELVREQQMSVERDRTGEKVTKESTNLRRLMKSVTTDSSESSDTSIRNIKPSKCKGDNLKKPLKAADDIEPTGKNLIFKGQGRTQRRCSQPLTAPDFSSESKGKKPWETWQHCHGCEKLKEEVNDFITDFINSIFREAVDVYCCHFGSSNIRRRQSHVEEIWIAPTSSSHPHTNPYFPDQKPFHKSESELIQAATKGNKGRRHFYSQSCDADTHHLQPRSAYANTNSSNSSKTTQNTKHEDCHLHDLDQTLQCKRCSWRISSSREYLLSWFNSSTSLYTEKPPTSVDWLAQDILLDAFDGALVELFGKTSLLDALQVTSTNSEHLVKNDEADGLTNPSAALLSYAEKLSHMIVSISSAEAAQHIAVSGCESCQGNGQNKNKLDQRVGRKPFPRVAQTPLELEEIASEFAQQLIEEAVHLVAGNSSLTKTERSIVAKHCVSGVYCDEPELMALLQWIAASMALASELHYHTCGNTQISQMDVICQIIVNHELTVGALLSEILVWCKKKQDHVGDVESLFDFLLIRLT